MGKPGAPIFFLMFFVFTIGEIVNTLGASPFISRRIPSSHRGRVSSYVNLGYMFGSTVGHLVAGFGIALIGYNFMFVSLALLGFIAIGVMMVNYRLDKKIFPKLYGIDEGF